MASKSSEVRVQLCQAPEIVRVLSNAVKFGQTNENKRNQARLVALKTLALLLSKFEQRKVRLFENFEPVDAMATVAGDNETAEFGTLWTTSENYCGN